MRARAALGLGKRLILATVRESKVKTRIHGTTRQQVARLFAELPTHVLPGGIAIFEGDLLIRGH